MTVFAGPLSPAPVRGAETDADLAVTQFDDPDPVVTGDPLTYQLNVTNSGPAIATNVTLHDTLPAGSSFVSAAADPGGPCAEDAGVVTCDLGSIDPFASTSVAIALTAPTTAGTVTNSAIVAGDEVDPVSDDNSSSEDTEVIAAQADLSIFKSADPNPVATGDTLTYAISVFNAGPLDATGVTVTDTLPAGVSFQSATSSQGTCDEVGGVVTCDLGGVPAFESPTVNIVVTAPSTIGTITNTASVDAEQDDLNSEDNSWSVDTEVVAPQADLSIFQSEEPDPVATDDTLTYSINVFNSGPLDATGVTFTDMLPAGVTFGSATPSQGSCGHSAGVVTCDLGTIAAFDNATVAIVITAPATTGTITNTASVDADQDDLHPEDNSSSEDTTVLVPGANLSVDQFDSPDPAAFGTQVTYSVTVRNAGPSDATEVTLTDTLPAASLVSVTPSQGSCGLDGGIATCSLGPIQSGDQADVAVTVTAPTESTTITNTAFVSGSPLDPDTVDNESAETTDIRPPCVPAVCIDNGVVLLAVNPEGHLNAQDGTGSPAGAGDVGLMFVSTGHDSTSPGCLCEGWGAADAGTGVTGYANISSDAGVNNMELESFVSTASTAVSTVSIENALRVTHDYHPSGATPNLYEATVTIENLTEAALSDVRYRRVMDWDIEPTAFSEFVTADGGNSENLLFNSENGFESANPLGSRSGVLTGDFVDEGPADHGALFDFGFGSLAAGETLTFNIYYGAAADEAGALAAINAVGAEVYSLGQPSTTDGPTLGTPNTFVFAFAGVGGDPIFSPIAVDDTLTVQENTSGSLNVLINDSDPDEDPLVVTANTDPANGSVACEPDGDCTYTPGLDFVGTDSFDYTISDGNAGFDTGTVTVTVEGENAPPLVDAGPDGAGIEGEAVAVGGSASDPDDDPLTTMWTWSADAADDGALCSFADELALETTVTCTDDGTYMLSLSADDGVNEPVTDTLTLTLSNAHPTVLIDTPLDGSAHEPNESVAVSASIGDDGTNDTHSCTIDWGDGVGPVPGTVTDHSCTGTHAYDLEGPYTITVGATDDDEGHGASSITIEVGQNEAPDAVDDSASTNETRPIAIAVLENDTDPDNDGLSVTASSAPENGTADCTSGTGCIYAPAAGFVGADSFMYTVSDGELTDTATVFVTVNACPILAPAIDGSGIVTGQSWIACSSPDAHAAAAFRPDGMTADGETAGLMTSGTAAGVETPGQSLSTSNVLDLRGANDVSILRLDLVIPAGASCLSFDLVFGSEEYPEFVGQYNDAFLAELDVSDWTVEGNTITAPGNFAFDHTGGVVSVNSTFFDETTVVLDNGTAYDGSTGVLDVRTPITAGVHALYLSIFDANDNVLDSGAFIEGLSAFAAPGDECQAGANQPPLATDDDFDVAEDSFDNVLDVLANDSDPDTDPLTLATIVTGPEHGIASIDTATGKIVYAPDADYNGPDGFTYRITDGRGASSTASVAIDVHPVNDLPTAAEGDEQTAQDQPIDVDIGALVDDVETSDADLTYEIVAPPEHGALSGSGPIFTYTPEAGYSGVDAFSYRVTDRGDPDACIGEPPVCTDALTSATQTVSIAIAAATFALTVSLAGDGTGSVTSDPAGIDCGEDCSQDYDDGTSVTLTATAASGSSFTGWSGDCSGESCTLTMDAARSVTATFELDPVNTQPTVDAGGPYLGDEGAAVSLDGTVSDPDAGDTLTTSWTYAAVDADAGATCSFASASAVDTSVTCTDDGSYTLTLTADDGVNEAVLDTASLTLSNVTPTVAISAPAEGSTFDIGETVSLSAAIDDDGANDSLTCAIDWGDGTADPGSIEGEVCSASHAYTAAGPYTVTVTASDDDEADGTDTVGITVAAATFELGVARAGSGTGTVSSDPAGINCGDDCSEDYDEAIVVTLTATADPGSSFIGWGGDCTGTGACQVTMDQARSVTATFDLDPTADLSVIQSDAPDPVTAGNAVQYYITVRNDGPDPATDVTLVSTLVGSTVMAAETPGCTADGNTVTCDLETIASGAEMNVSIVVTAPNVSVLTTISNSATVSASETDPNLGDNSDTQTTTVQPASGDPDVAAGWVPATGATVATGAGNGPTKKDPMTTAVTVPPGFPGMVTITEGPITDCADGYECFGQQAEITAPTTTAETPLRLTFRFHSSTLPGGTQPGDVVMFHDEVLVERCDDGSGTAEPDPCIESVARIKGVMTVVVLSSENGLWRGGR